MDLLATADLMRGFDRQAMTSLGISGLTLMENAGRAFVDELERARGPLAGREVVVVCGKGNNGGDGFVIARHTANRGARVTALLLAPRRAVRGDARANLDIALRMSRRGASGLRVNEIRSGGAFPRRADIIVDAIFGTGFTGDARGLPREAISWINGAGAYVAAVDVPSGIDATTGRGGDAAVRADLTVAMGMAKIGHFVGRGASLSGVVRVADISIPPGIMRVKRGGTFRVGPADAATVLPARPRNAHKYSAGRVLVIGGSRSFSGAPLMTAQSALRTGAGSVVLAFPSSLRTVIARRLTEVILAPLPETAAGTLGSGAVSEALDRATRADVVAIGPGLSRDEEALLFVREFLSKAPLPVVVDADALSALKGVRPAAFGAGHVRILTPHTGEFSALTGIDAAEADAMRVSVAGEAARALRSIVVLKGAPTITAVPGGATYVNSTGNPGMATVGSGDVLTGVIAGMLAQGATAECASWGGVFVHGRAGDIARDRYGMRGLIATDIADALPGAMESLNPAAR